MENIIKELEQKAMACSMSNKESRARKGAYVDAIVMMKEALRKPAVSGRSELLIAFANELNEAAGFPLNSEGFEEFVNEFLSKQ